MAGCRDNVGTLSWDYVGCSSDCDVLTMGKVNCKSMCSNIEAEITTDEDALCFGLNISKAYNVNMMGCREDTSGDISWSQSECLADCTKLAAGGLNCRGACNLIDDETTDKQTTICTK